ncbi:DedA family protein [Brevundimonas sp. S30B]|jgi:membrane protein YqaA with SNARE-associated domain|uniref:YqaA family protein n=1 Tax=unclassified Brevundimonas TaxID=2622653 RepID=UPI001071DAF2|nr:MULTISPECIES: YqaA family protein [unclassified Brevundimonas]QBX36479.1 DedA family protein [Brevundimonas sp. MF30-B]TFW00731.1 DedA family protein [Brevundimonas sp. S30B]
MLRKMYDWVFSLARHRHATKSLAAISFAESSFFPIPPDVMLAPMVLARPDRAYFYATVCTIASVLGGLLGYAIGHFLEPVGMSLLALMGKADTFETSKALFQEHGAWVILIKGLTPIPYKLITIAAGIFSFSLPLFIVLSVITRGARFFLVAFVLKTFGPAMLEVIEKRLAFWTILFVVVLVGAIVAVRFI